MALSRAQRNALRATQGKTTRGAAASTPVTATGVGGKVYSANQPVVDPNAGQGIVEKKVTPTAYDPTKDIQALSEAKKKTQILGLKQRMEEAQAGIGERRATMTPEYQEQRRKASVQSRMGAKSFGEYLARRGLARSGESAQARMMQQSALQGQLGDIGLQEQAERDKLGRQEQQLQQRYLQDVGLAEQGADDQTMQMLINARTRQGELGRADAIRAEEQARADQLRQQQIRSNYLSQIGIADPYGGQQLTPEQMAQVGQYQDNYALALQDPTLDPQTRALIEQARFQKVTGDPRMMEQYGREYMTPQAINQQEAQYAQSIQGNVIPDYQAEINRVAGDNDPTNDWQLQYLKAEQQRKIAGIQQAEQQATEEERKLEKEKFERDFKEREQKRKESETRYDIGKPYYKPESKKEKTTKPKFSNTEAEKMLDKMTTAIEGRFDQTETVDDKGKQVDWVMQKYVDGEIDQKGLEYLNTRKQLGIDADMQRDWMTYGSYNNMIKYRIATFGR